MNNNSRSKVWYFLKIALPFLVLIWALATDFYLPPRDVVSSLYAIPIFIAAFQYRLRGIYIVGFFSITIYFLEALEEHVDFATLFISILGLTISLLLAILFCIQKSKANYSTKKETQAKEQLQAYLAMISHDLAQPVTSVKTYIQILIKTCSDDKNIKILKNTENSVHVLERLIKDLQLASKIGRGEFTIQRHKTDIVTILRQTIQSQQASTKHHSIILKSPKEIYGNWDEERISQLFSNLISNAIKYSPKGHRILVAAEKNNHLVSVSVTDRGLGIPVHQRENLFQPFMRLHKESGIKGTGLGLYISKAIVDAHQGKISVKSRKGKGTTFIVKLPL